MLTIEGNFSDGKTSRVTSAYLLQENDGWVSILPVADDQPPFISHAPDYAYDISTRLGSAPRVITFTTGETFTTNDHTGVDRLGQLSSKETWQRYLPRLEKNIALVFCTGLVAVVIVWLTITRGIPELAKIVAFNLPPEVERRIGTGTLEFIDANIANPSELPIAIQEKLQIKAAPYLIRYGPPDTLLVFRNSSFGANAFALPSGIVLFTDDLVNLAENDDELLAVLFHELGHLKYRHILRRSLQGSFITILTVLLTGDLSGTNEIIAGIPLLLIDTAYSRDFEREADDFAMQRMTAEDIPLAAFENILNRLEESHRIKNEQRTFGDDSGNFVTDYLSSHPGTPERVNLIRAYQSPDRPESHRFE